LKGLETKKKPTKAWEGQPLRSKLIQKYKIVGDMRATKDRDEREEWGKQVQVDKGIFAIANVYDSLVLIQKIL
jgi:hypothetical protein